MSKAENRFDSDILFTELKKLSISIDLITKKKSLSLICLFGIFSKSQLTKEKTGEKQDEQITNGRIQRKEEKEEDKKDKKDKGKEEEEEEESWEVLKTTNDNRIESNGMEKKVQ